MGAYGGTAEAGIAPHDWAMLADLTNDGAVDWADFAHMAAGYTPANRPQPGDINRNASPDLANLALLSDDWLKVTSWRR